MKIFGNWKKKNFETVMIRIVHRARKEIIGLCNDGTLARGRDSQFWEFGKPIIENAFLEHQHDYASYPSIV